MSDTLEKAVIQLTKTLETIKQEANPIGIYMGDRLNVNSATIDVQIDIHLNDEDFDRLFGRRIVCIEPRDSDSWPYQKHITIGNVKFFCLLKNLEKYTA